MDDIEQLEKRMVNSSFTVAITGAGISAPAGIGVMRALNMVDAAKVASTTLLRTTPKFYYSAAWRAFLEPMFVSGPTLAHRELARLEQSGHMHGVITTNLDCLHTLAGSQNVAEIQGSFGVNTCVKCDARHDGPELWNQGEVPRCPGCGGALAPYPAYSNIGLLHEAVDQATQWVSQAELILIIGTTGPYGSVYIGHFNPGAHIVQINPNSTEFDNIADVNIRSAADDVFSQLSI